MRRYFLQPSKHKGCWVATDREHGIVIVFEEHRFNDTQKVTLLNDTDADAAQLAGWMRELGDWLRVNHYNKIF